MDPALMMMIMSAMQMLPGILGGGGAGGTPGNQVMPQSVDPKMQGMQRRLFAFFLDRMGQQATPRPEGMPLSANWHPNITDSSNIWRSMAGLGGMAPWQGSGGTPFQYGGQVPQGMPGPSFISGANVRQREGGTPDPYDPRSISRRQLAP